MCCRCETILECIDTDLSKSTVIGFEFCKRQCSMNSLRRTWYVCLFFFDNNVNTTDMTQKATCQSRASTDLKLLLTNHCSRSACDWKVDENNRVRRSLPKLESVAAIYYCFLFFLLRSFNITSNLTLVTQTYSLAN